MDDIEHDVWSSRAWRDEVMDWVAAELGARGHRLTGPVEQPRIRPWSTQLTVPTTTGLLWFKENAPGLAFEAGLVAVLATLAPEQVVVPFAVDPPRGRLLSRDAGPTLATLERTDDATWVRVLQEYAALQRRLAGHRSTVVATGVPVLDPAEAGAWIQGYADELAGRPAADPCRITADERAAVRTQVVRLAATAAELTAGPIPLSLEHNDLHTNNVFVPVSGSRLRFFDFGDALWAHPFTSVWLALRAMADAGGLDPADLRVRRLGDAYLEVWSDLAPLVELRALQAAAAAFGPVHRVHAWVRCLSTTEPRYWAPDLITAGHDWLLQFARPGG